MSYIQITPQTGFDLIALATAANPLIIDEIRLSETPLSAVDLQSNPQWFEDGTISWDKTGSIASTGATNNIARIVGRFDPDGNEYDGWLFCIFAHVPSAPTPRPLVWGLSSEALKLPAEVVSTTFTFNIEVNAGTAVQSVIQGDSFITIAEYERIVTTHKAGNATQGDEQHIYGHKHFRNQVTLEAGAFLFSGAQAAFQSRVDFNSDTYMSGAIFTGHALPDTNSISLGSDAQRFANGYFFSLDATALRGGSSHVVNADTLIPYDSARTLGTSSNRWATVYTVSIDSSSVTTPSATITNLVATNLTASGTVRMSSLGTASQPVSDARIQTLTVTNGASIPTLSATTITAANSLNVQGTATADKFVGVLPTLLQNGSSLDVEVGAIFLIKNQMDGTGGFKAGMTAAITAEKFLYCDFTGNTGSTPRYAPPGRYKMLSDAPKNGIGLVMYVGSL